MIATDAGQQREACWKRDKGVCYVCGQQSIPEGNKHRWRKTGAFWQVDHKLPLFENKEGDITYWLLENLGTICTKCHREKSAREAAQRAEQRRSLKV